MYVLHYVPDWASICVHLALAEMGVPYLLNLIDADGGGLTQPDHLRRQPFGLIPALDTPAGPIFETGAILLWLSERHGLAPAPGSPERAAFLSWFVFTNQSLHTGTMDLLHPERAGGEACAPAVSAAARARLMAQLGVLEAMVLRDGPDWLSPAQPSVLSIYLSVLLRWMKVYPPFAADAIDGAGFPALHAVAAALEQRPAIIAAAAAEGLTGRFLSEPEA